MRILVDTNLVARLMDKSSSQHVMAKEAIAACLLLRHELVLCTQNLIEIWNVATRPLEKNGLGWTCANTYQQIQFLQQSFMVLQNSSDVFTNWLKLVNDLEVKGKQVHDAHIVAFALQNSVQAILTFNTADFQRYSSNALILHPSDLIKQVAPE